MLRAPALSDRRTFCGSSCRCYLLPISSHRLRRHIISLARKTLIAPNRFRYRVDVRGKSSASGILTIERAEAQTIAVSFSSAFQTPWKSRLEVHCSNRNFLFQLYDGSAIPEEMSCDLSLNSECGRTGTKGFFEDTARRLELFQIGRVSWDAAKLISRIYIDRKFDVPWHLERDAKKWHRFSKTPLLNPSKL